MPRRARERLMRIGIGAAVARAATVNNFEPPGMGVFRIIDKANVTKRCGRWGQIRQGLTGRVGCSAPSSEVGATQGF